MSKTGNVAIDQITTHANKVAPDIGLTPADIQKWRENIIGIDCLCDPVKRLFSDFLHVKAAHQLKSHKPNREVVYSTRLRFSKHCLVAQKLLKTFSSAFLGSDSKLFPFKNLTFDDFVDKYIPEYKKMSNKNPIKTMIRTGFYDKPVETGRNFFGDKYVLIDGGRFTVQPWQSLAEIERKLFPEEEDLFYTQNRFHKREDGYYCLVEDISELKITS